MKCSVTFRMEFTNNWQNCLEITVEGCGCVGTGAIKVLLPVSPKINGMILSHE